jgi:hypothetical protein
MRSAFGVFVALNFNDPGSRRLVYFPDTDSLSPAAT